MSRLVDLFGYLGIVLHGLAILAQSVAVGSAAFLALVATPLARDLPPALPARLARLCLAAALALVAIELLDLSLEGAVLADTVGLGPGQILTADFAVASLLKSAAALSLALLAAARARGPWLLAASAAVLAAATLTTHAAARLSGNVPLLGAEFLHILGAAIWIGGIPAFVLTLAALTETDAVRAVGTRFSRVSAAGVACIAVSGTAMALTYIGAWDAFYGTAYGVMVGAKIAMFGMLLLLGLGNLLVTERLRRGETGSVLRLRRFAEVEIGIGISIFFAAASLTSVPPGVDLTQDRASWHDIVARDLTPEWPRLVSPDHARLAIPALQHRLDAEAAAAHAASPRAAFVEGAGDLPPRNAEDIAWSEYNHHWAGLFVLAVGLLALLNRAGLRWARHWPLVFLGLAAFLFIRSDPEVWPLGSIGLIESLRDVEVVQHRAFVLLVAAFGLFEWAVRIGRLGGGWRYVFPLICAGGGALLLTHNHTIANVRDALLIEFTHTPLALAAIVAGWARWLELRLPGPVGRAAGWVWPGAFLAIGALLVLYREA